MQLKYQQRGDIIKDMKKDFNQMKKTMTECIHKCFQLISNGNALSALSAKSEQLRRDFAEQLRATNIKKEYLRNQFSKLS